MFDWYEPRDDFACAVCGRPILEWQGKDAACALFVWREGEAHPIAQRADEPIDRERFTEWQLPTRFVIYAWCEEEHHSEAQGTCSDGVWSETQLIDHRA